MALMYLLKYLLRKHFDALSNKGREDSYPVRSDVKEGTLIRIAEMEHSWTTRSITSILPSLSSPVFADFPMCANTFSKPVTTRLFLRNFLQLLLDISKCFCGGSNYLVINLKNT